MSMGTIESYHQVISEELVTKVVGKPLLDQFLSRIKPFIADFGDSDVYDTLGGDNWGNIDPDEAGWKALVEAYDSLRNAFAEQTGIVLYYTFLDGDGDCYDDIEPRKWYWELRDADVWVPKQLTGKAKEFIKKFGEIDLDQRHSKFG